MRGRLFLEGDAGPLWAVQDRPRAGTDFRGWKCVCEGEVGGKGICKRKIFGGRLATSPLLRGRASAGVSRSHALTGPGVMPRPSPHGNGPTHTRLVAFQIAVLPLTAPVLALGDVAVRTKVVPSMRYNPAPLEVRDTA